MPRHPRHLSCPSPPRVERRSCGRRVPSSRLWLEGSFASFQEFVGSVRPGMQIPSTCPLPCSSSTEFYQRTIAIAELLSAVPGKELMESFLSCRPRCTYNTLSVQWRLRRSNLQLLTTFTPSPRSQHGRESRGSETRASPERGQIRPAPE